MILSLLLSGHAVLAAALVQPVPRPTPTPEVMIVAPGSAITLEPPSGPGVRAEARLDGGLLSPLDRLVAPGAGDHWLVVGSRDPVGGLSMSRWIRLRVDSEAPSLRIATEPARVAAAAGALWGGPGISVKATAEDNLAGAGDVRLRCGDAAAEAPVTAQLVLKTTATCEARAVDKVSNSASASETIRVDSQGPRAEIRTNGPVYRGGERLFLGPTATLSVDVADHESGVANWVGRVDTTVAREPQSFAGPYAAGAHEASVEALDRVGNLTVTPTLSFTVDAMPPRITWRIPGPSVVNAAGESVYRSPVRLEVSATDDGAGLARLAGSEDGVTFETFANERVSHGEALTIRATDRVGNESEVRVTWRVDARAPVISIDGVAQSPETEDELAVTAGQTLRLSATDDASGVARFTYALDASRGTAAPTDLRFLDAGEFDLTLEAIDALGNLTRIKRHVKVRRSR